MTRTILIAGAACAAWAGMAVAQAPGAAATTGAPLMSDPAGTAIPSNPQIDETTTPRGAPPAEPRGPARTLPAQEAPVPAPGDPAGPPAPTPATPPPGTAADAGATAQAVRAEWPRYDRTGRGTLTPLEFGEWVMVANGQPVGDATRASNKAVLPSSKVLNATATAFAQADANKDHAVSPEELTAFLQG